MSRAERRRLMPLPEGRCPAKGASCSDSGGAGRVETTTEGAGGAIYRFRADQMDSLPAGLTIATGNCDSRRRGQAEEITRICVLNIELELCKVLRRLHSCWFQRSRHVREA
jgi:hypothetical protein